MDPPSYLCLRYYPSLSESLEASDDFMKSLLKVCQRIDNTSGDALITNVDGSKSVLRTKDEMSRSPVFLAFSLYREDLTLQKAVASDVASRSWESLVTLGKSKELYERAREIIYLAAAGVGDEESPENKGYYGKSSGMSWGMKFRMSLEVQKIVDSLIDRRMGSARLKSNPTKAAILALKMATSFMIALKRVYSSMSDII